MRMQALNVRTLGQRLFSCYGIASAPVRMWRQRTFQPSGLRRVLINVAAPWMGLGDFVSVTPLVQAVREVARESEVYLLTSPGGVGGIIDFFPSKVSVLKLPASEHSQSGMLRLAWKTIRPLQFDLVIHGYLEPWWSVAYINVFGRIPHSIGYSPFVEDRSPNVLHTITLDYDYPWLVVFAYDDQLAEPIGFHGSWQASLAVGGDLQEASVQRLATQGVRPHDTILGLHPGCNKRNEAKKWPIANFVEAAERFLEEHRGKVMVFGGPDEAEDALAITRHLGRQRAIAIVGEPLQQVLPLIQQCTVFLSNDSGLMHASLALGVPTVGIFGPVNGAKYAAQYRGLSSVFLQERMPCGPCYATPGYLSCRQIPPPCLNAISVNQAYCAIEDLLPLTKNVSAPIQSQLPDYRVSVGKEKTPRENTVS